MGVDSVLAEEIAEKERRNQAGVFKAHSPAEAQTQFHGIDDFFLLFFVSFLRGIGKQDECAVLRERKLERCKKRPHKKGEIFIIPQLPNLFFPNHSLDEGVLNALYVSILVKYRKKNNFIKKDKKRGQATFF